MNLITKKPVVILIAVAAGILLLAAGRADWVTGTVDGVTGPAAAAAPGSDAAPGLAGLALVGIAAAVATATSGRVGRWIALVALAAVGLGVIALSARTLLDPAGVLGTVAAAQSGGTGAFEATGSASAWPWLAAAAGVLLLVSCLGALLGSKRWAGLSSRYDSPVSQDGETGGSRGERVDSAWDRVSRGDDPSVD